jgi:hypothetical protein
MRIFLATVVALSFVAYAAAIELGDESPALDRPEVVTQGGGYGDNVNIDDYIADGKTTLVSFGYDS